MNYQFEMTLEYLWIKIHPYQEIRVLLWKFRPLRTKSEFYKLLKIHKQNAPLITCKSPNSFVLNDNTENKHTLLSLHSFSGMCWRMFQKGQVKPEERKMQAQETQEEITGRWWRQTPVWSQRAGGEGNQSVQVRLVWNKGQAHWQLSESCFLSSYPLLAWKNTGVLLSEIIIIINQEWQEHEIQ